MTIEHWIDENNHTVFPKGDYDKHAPLFAGPATKCCEIEGNTWDSCLRKYHEHMGWAPPEPEPTNPL